MAWIPSGCFQMGDAFGEGDSDERPVHRVCLDEFWMDQYEVTNRQFRAFVDATGYTTTAESEGWSWVYRSDSWEQVSGARWDAPQGPGSDLTGLEDHPVVHVSWHDAQAYCEWAGLRLPTEAEWEYAARGGLEGKRYPWGDEIDRSKANYGTESCCGGDDSDGYFYTAPVGSFPPNGYGLYDMAGNVWEWCADWYDEEYYGRSPERNPTGPASGSNRVQRGGSWHVDPYYLRTADRVDYTPSGTNTNDGFRCARPVD